MSETTPEDLLTPADAREAVIAVVPHRRAGLVHLLVGAREVVVHDHDLANRIIDAAGGPTG